MEKKRGKILNKEIKVKNTKGEIKMKKLVTLTLAILFTTLLSNYSQAQYSTTRTVVKKQTYGYLELSPAGGFIMPLGVFADQYKASPRAGLDLTYRVNKEVGLFGNFTYNALQNKNPNMPSSSYIEATAGPRYYFSHPKLNSQFFLEGGVGAYIFNTPAYTVTTNNVSETFGATSDTRVGVSTGLGGIINLSKQVDLFVRGKYNTIFREGGTSSFISTDGGVTIKLQ